MNSLGFFKKIIIKKQLKHHQKCLEGKRGWMVIQLVIELGEDTAKYYVIIGGKGKKTQPLETRTRCQLGTVTMGTSK